MALTIVESWPAWHALAHRAAWAHGGATDDVLVMVSAQPVDDLAGVQRQAAAALGVRGSGVLPLLAVEALGEGVAWIYPYRRVVSPAFFTERGLLGHRACASIVARVARIVAEHPHPGPVLSDVLFTERGEVLLAGFDGPLGESVEVPGGERGESAVVYRLGALLAQLLAGGIQPGSSRESHDAAIRRTMIRAMSMPGAVFSDRYSDWLSGMLAWEPDARPPLSRIAPGLDALASAAAGLPLEAAIATSFEGWLAGAATLAPGSSLPTLEDGMGTMPGVELGKGRTTLASDDSPLGDLGFEDDRTVESIVRDSVDGTPPSVLERGAIPVEVGPPAEVLRKRRATLPPGFLDGEGEDTVPNSPPPGGRPSSDPTVPMTRSSADEDAWPAWTTAVGALLLGVAVALGLWLLFG